MQWLLTGSYVAALAATALFLVHRYRSRGGAGFLVLIAALPAWPLLMAGINRFVIEPAIDSLMNGESVALWPFSLASSGDVSTGTILIGIGHGTALLQSTLTLLGLWLVFPRDATRPGTLPNPPMQRIASGDR